MICTVTYNPAVDQTLVVDDSLAPDEIHRPADARFDPGGKGINVSQYLDALDVETLATGIAGGFTGGFLEEALREAGLEISFAPVDSPTRLNTTILTADGEYKFNQRGPQVDADVVSAVGDRLEATGPDRVLVGGSLPQGLDAGAVDAVAERGAWETVVDVGGDVLAALEGDYALCTPNRSELTAATGERVDTIEDCVDAARTLRADRFERVLVSLGADGAVIVGPEGALHASALDVDVLDTVGAGDALVAGVLAGFDREMDLADAMALGVAVASRAVGQAGTAVPAFDGLPAERRDVEMTWLNGGP